MPLHDLRAVHAESTSQICCFSAPLVGGLPLLSMIPDIFLASASMSLGNGFVGEL